MKKLILCMAVIIFYMNSHAQTWSTTGNSGITPPKNFLGTTDANALMFKVNNQPSAYIDYTAAKANTSFGYQSLKGLTGSSNTAYGYKTSFSNTAGKNNTSVGAYALYFNTTGYSNIAIGIGALYKNTTYSNLVAIGDSALYNDGIGATETFQADANTAVGSKALYSNTTGSSNTAIGYNTLYNNTTGYSNVAEGLSSMYFNTTGYGNIGIGASALAANTVGNINTATGFGALIGNYTGNYNTASGGSSLYSNQTGSYNTATGYSSLYHNTASYLTATGYYALYNNTIGDSNTAVGSYSMYTNTTGANNNAFGYSSLFANSTGAYNTAFGTYTLKANTTGTDNAASGYQSLYTNTTGSYNVAEGATSLYSNTSGSYNTALGVNSLYNNTSASYNTALGFLALGFADVPGADNVAVGAFAGPTLNTDGVYNSVAVGEDCYNTASNQARIGNSSTTSIGGYVSWSNVSDGRIKKNIKQNVPGLAFINRLTPVTYNLDLDAIDKLIVPAAKKDGKGNMIQPAQQEADARKAKEQTLYTGFVAQDVEKAAKSVNYDFSGVDAAKNSKDLYGLRYADFVVPLVKAVQELSKMNAAKDSAIQQQNNKITDLQKQIDDLKAMVQSLTADKSIATAEDKSSEEAISNINLSGASLDQNVPNPLANTTSILYHVPSGNALLIITDLNGKTIKQLSLPTGAGTVNIDASTLSTGAYSYTLVIDGKTIASKKMVVAR